jgi:hypothetical protein
MVKYINPGSAEVEKALKAGRAVYYGENILGDGEVVKEYPDSRKEIVTFDDETGEEIFLRTYE